MWTHHITHSLQEPLKNRPQSFEICACQKRESSFPTKDSFSHNTEHSVVTKKNLDRAASSPSCIKDILSCTACWLLKYFPPYSGLELYFIYADLNTFIWHTTLLAVWCMDISLLLNVFFLLCMIFTFHCSIGDTTSNGNVSNTRRSSTQRFNRLSLGVNWGGCSAYQKAPPRTYFGKLRCIEALWACDHSTLRFCCLPSHRSLSQSRVHALLSVKLFLPTQLLC